MFKSFKFSVALLATLCVTSVQAGEGSNKHRPFEANRHFSEGALHQAHVHGTDHKITYREVNGRAMMDDVMLGSIEEVKKHGVRNIFNIKQTSGSQPAAVSLTNPSGASNGVTSPVQKWPSKTVYYTIDSSMNAKGRQAVTDGFKQISSLTTVKFVARTTQKNYVRIFVGDGCWSAVGMIGGRQDLSIGTGCEYPEVVSHEAMHVLGFQHEQCRPDRDSYVTIQLANVISGLEYAFEKFPASTTQAYGSFDFDSIMMYEPYAFSKNGQPTIVPKSSTGRSLTSFGFALKPSAGDIKAIKAFYP